MLKKLTVFFTLLLTNVCSYSQTEQEKVSDTSDVVCVLQSDIDSALVGFLLLDQCEEDRTTLTKGFNDLQKVVSLKDQIIAKQVEDSVLQSEAIAQYILQQNLTEKLLKKQKNKSTIKSVLHYTFDAALTALLVWSLTK
jgi:hypothetical protein